MFANYCRILFRNLRKTRLYAFINILSLGIGIAAIIWGIQTYRYYASFDQFHQNREHIFRVLITVAGGDGIKGPCPAPVGPAALKDYPVIQEAVRWESRPLAIFAPRQRSFCHPRKFYRPRFF